MSLVDTVLLEDRNGYIIIHFPGLGRSSFKEFPHANKN